MTDTPKRFGPPEWPWDQVKGLINADNWDYATRNCKSKAARFGYDSEVIKKALFALKAEDYKETWLEAACDEGIVVADVYKFWWSGPDVTGVRTRPNYGDHLYIKFSICQNGAGDYFALISFHPDT